MYLFCYTIIKIVLLTVNLTYSPKDSLSRVCSSSWQSATTHTHTHSVVKNITSFVYIENN